MAGYVYGTRTKVESDGAEDGEWRERDVGATG